MLGTAAALALMWAMAFPAAGDPVSYEAAVAAERAAVSTAAGDEGSDSGTSVLSPEQQALMADGADWTARVNLYHAGGGGATGNDSLGCRPIAMRTIAVDPRYIPRRTRLFIPETVGMRMPDGAMLNIAKGYCMTNTMDVVAGRVMPDVPSVVDWGKFGTAEDPVIRAASAWLRSR